MTGSTVSISVLLKFEQYMYYCLVNPRRGNQYLHRHQTVHGHLHTQMRIILFIILKGKTDGKRSICHEMAS